MKSVCQHLLQNSYVCQLAGQRGDTGQALPIPPSWFGSCMTPQTAMGFQSWEASLTECRAQRAGGLPWMQLQLSRCLAGKSSIPGLSADIKIIKESGRRKKW